MQNKQWKTRRLHILTSGSNKHSSLDHSGQIHQTRRYPWSGYLIHDDLWLVNSPICKYSAEKRVIMPLQEWKQQWPEGARIFPLVIFSANRRASTLFVAMRMSAGISDQSTFEVCIAYICLIWEDWPSLIYLDTSSGKVLTKSFPMVYYMLGYCRGGNMFYSTECWSFCIHISIFYFR